ncbi:hypothetical protein MRB53_038943 [Persea americana]|nr:hypothetical protein MRB53_038943 [Persea americana]
MTIARSMVATVGTSCENFVIRRGGGTNAGLDNLMWAKRVKKPLKVTKTATISNLIRLIKCLYDMFDASWASLPDQTLAPVLAARVLGKPF